MGKPNIYELKNKRDINGLIKLLNHRNKEFAAEAAYALGELGDIRASDALYKIIDHLSKKYPSTCIFINLYKSCLWATMQISKLNRQEEKSKTKADMAESIKDKFTEEYGLNPEEAKVLEELEKKIGKPIYRVDKFEWFTNGVKIKGNKVEGLQLMDSRLTMLPESIGNLKSLKILSLRRNKLSTLPESLGNLTSLKELYLNSNNITTFPESIGNLTSLKELNLTENQLKTLPESIGNLKSLKELKLDENQLKTLPESIGNLTSLEELNLGENQLKTLPESIGNLKSLRKLEFEEFDAFLKLEKKKN